MKVRTRYAPSPTGFFHVGGARTALFNYLFAKHHGGTFICRIEDTDVERNVKGGIDSQLDNLEWLKITPDESPRTPGEYPPYIQTQKLERYQQLAKELIDKGLAYYCFCSADELKKQREQALDQGKTPKYNRTCLSLSKEQVAQKLKEGIPSVIRLKMPDNCNIEWVDLVRGKVDVPTSALTDPVLLKSNGIPMYNFAVVVDDYDMQITHVLRGEEHLSNTPYQIAIKQALGFDKQPIEYGHLSIIVDETGKKLSKRNDTLKQFIEDYKQMGFMPEAVTNFLALLGWSTFDNVEIMGMNDIVKQFDNRHISKAPAFFDIKKMMWISNEYFKKEHDRGFINFVKPFLTFDVKHFGDKLNDVLLIFKPQINYANQINNLVENTFLSTDFITMSQEIKSYLKTDNCQKCLATLHDELTNAGDITIDGATKIIENIKVKTGLKGKDLFFPIRFAAIGKEHGPEMNKILHIVGRDEILKNIKLLKSI